MGILECIYMVQLTENVGRGPTYLGSNLCSTIYYLCGLGKSL